MSEKEKKNIKGNPERDMLPQHEKNIVVSETVPLQQISDTIHLTYRKPSKEILPKSFFVIISGGEVRKKKYFKIISNQDIFQRIKIEFIADPDKLSPKGMFEIALIKKEHYLSSMDTNTEKPDKIFLVSDVDHFMPELLEIKTKCTLEHLHLIISNPCFEVWLYYAHRSDIPNFPIPEKKETISQKFKTWLPTAIKSGINPTTSVFNILENIKNAKANYKEDTTGIPELFSTNMFVLAEELFPLIEPELNRLSEENTIKTELQKKKRK